MSTGTDFKIKRAVDPERDKKKKSRDNDETCENNMELQDCGHNSSTGLILEV